MNTGERISHFRKKRGYTVNKLACIAGVSQSYLRDLELGKKQPTVEYLSYICTALGITLCEFFDEKRTYENLPDEIADLTAEQKEALFAVVRSMKMQ